MIEKYQFNDFTYIKDYGSKNESPIIEHNFEKPEQLFKFYSISKYNVDALIKGYLYALHPIELNDMLDSSPFLLYTTQKIGFGYYVKLMMDSYQKDKQNFEKYFEEDSNGEDMCRGYISKFWYHATNLFGIISMTSKENNTLMWPHYTQEKGFQLEFKTSVLENSIKSKIKDNGDYLGLYPVNYTEKLSPIDISKFKDMSVPLYYATNVKSNKWKYENEWRFLINKPNMGIPNSKNGFNPLKDYLVNKENRYVFYDNKIIEGITLGKDFFNGREFEIEWLDSMRIKVKVKNEECHGRILNFIFDNLNDKLYLSGLKYELDENNVRYIIRTKENCEINKHDTDSFILTRTNTIVKFY